LTKARIPVLLGVSSDADQDERRSLEAIFAASNLVAPAGSWMYPQGRTSSFAALEDAAAMLRSNAAQLVIVGGIDSLCAPDNVRRLVAAERVLGPGTEGTIPGEAAAFLLLAAAEHPAAKLPTAVRLEGITLNNRGVPLAKADRVVGDALADSFRALRESGAARVHQVIAAHSGEGYFGRSFAHAYLREADLMPEPLEVELTADRLGDVGAAAGILGLALAWQIMATDDHNGPRRALVYSESDAGEIGAAIIEGSPTSWQRTGLDLASISRPT
jgi:3-oxoacyl-[acyl-carrier-protein] synthase-1